MTQIIWPIDKNHHTPLMSASTLPSISKTFLMEVIFILIALSLLVAGGFLAAFLWAVRSGQYEDDYTPSVRMLFDDVPASGADKKQSE